MAEEPPVIHVSTPAAVITVAMLLGSLVALASINAGVAIVLVIFALIFGDEFLDRVTMEISDEPTALSEPLTTEPPSDETDDALTLLRRRYARGDLSDAEFERKLETLVATETVADVERHLSDDGRRADNRGARSTRDRARPDADREREFPDVDRELERG